MNDDWLRELAQVNQEDQAEGRSRLDERWDRLSAGELSPEEEAELLALAESSDEGREAYEAFRPLGPEFEAKVVQAIREQGLPDAAPKPPAKLLPFRRRAWIGGWIAAAAAAAILTVSLRPSAPLPDYASLKISGEARERGDQPKDTTPTLRPGSPFTAYVNPQTAGAYENRLDARCFLSCDRELRSVEIKSLFPSGGSVEINGTMPNAGAGTCILWAVISRRGKMPRADELRSLLKSTPVRQRNWVAVSRNIRIEPRGP
jgi:hypothetical protein